MAKFNKTYLYLFANKHILKVIISASLIIFFLLQPIGVIDIPLNKVVERVASDLRLRISLQIEDTTNKARPQDNSNTSNLSPAIENRIIDERIVIADIDEKSVQSIGRWPWNRKIVADLINTLFDHYEINALGFDVIFAEQDNLEGLNVLNTLEQSVLGSTQAFQQQANILRQQLQYDRLFADSIRDRNVVLGIVFQSSDRHVNQLPPPIAELDPLMSIRLDLPKPKGFSANLPIFHESSPFFGFFDNPMVDPDGLFRRVPLLQDYQAQLYPSLALALTRLALNNPDLDIQVGQSGDYISVESVQLGRYLIPVDPTSSVTVPYLGSGGSFRYASIMDILDKSFPKIHLQNKIILVGTTAPGLLDLRATPVDEQMPGVEVHANVIAGILDYRIPYTPGYLVAAELILYLILGLLMAIIPNRVSPLSTIIFTLSLILIVIIGNYWIWKQNIVLPLAAPVFIVLIFFMFHMSWGFFFEDRSKRAITNLFGQYVPPDLVDEMASKPKEVSLEGESRELSVLFSDVRGFTAISEGLIPKELTELMNEFLTPMTRVIHEHRGTVDKYMGDAIMAFWGAPLVDQNHAHGAVSSALKMQSEIEGINLLFDKKGWPQIQVGVGINTGLMNVGNMGSTFRMAYTVLGDSVNLGSRLEGLTKQYGVNILVSESTMLSAPDFLYRAVDWVKVKGKDEPVKIFEPVNWKNIATDVEKEEILEWSNVLEHYHNQSWDSALNLIDNMIEKFGAKTIFYVFKERILWFRNNPPGKNWDGVFTHSEK